MAQQEEELRARRNQEDVWRRHLEQCLSLTLETAVSVEMLLLYDWRIHFPLVGTAGKFRSNPLYSTYQPWYSGRTSSIVGSRDG